MEPVYHNVIFLVVVLVFASSAADLFQPRWKLRRRQPRRIKEALREARDKGAETREWFSEHEIRDVRSRGAVGLAIGLIFIFCLQPSVGFVGAPIKSSTSGDAELADRIRPELESIVRRNAIIGMTVVVVADGKEAIIGLGRRDLHTTGPPDGKTLYEIGSISTTFTGILLAHEIRNGRANLDDPVNDHLPAGVRLPDTTNVPVQLRHLTTHRSGFPRRTEGMGDLIGTLVGRSRFRDFDDKSLWAAVGSVPFQSPPGEKFLYSNFATALLGTLLARHQHDSYLSMHRDVIAGPLGMEDTVIRLNDDQRSRWAQGYHSIFKLGRMT